MVFGTLLSWITFGVGCLGLVDLVTFFLPYLLCNRLRRPQNLKKKYDAEWALVTGGSSGIGLAVVRRLAEQGMNVVVVAMPDDALTQAVEVLRKDFASQQFRAVGANLAGNSFMSDIEAATADIVPQVVVLNAGYIVTGFFADTALSAQVNNFNCNAACVVAMAHHFINRLKAEGRRGCITMTSSPAGFMPCPFSSMYGATKAFLTEFAVSLAPEVGVDGIDVLVVHPSPVTSAFYDRAHKLDALEMFRKTGTSPATIADALMTTVGRTVVCDQGYYSLSVRLLLKVVDVTFMANVIKLFAPWMKDFKAMRKETQAKPSTRRK